MALTLAGPLGTWPARRVSTADLFQKDDCQGTERQLAVAGRWGQQRGFCCWVWVVLSFRAKDLRVSQVSKARHP